MVPKFSYDTYQAVRHNLTVYFTVCLWIAGLFVYFLVLSTSDRNSIEGWFADLQGYDAPVQTLTIGGVLVAISVVMVEILKVHDRIYDRYLIGWRRSYDSEFILPRLLRPFDACDLRFYRWARENSDIALKKLFYPFVMDRETKISSNTLVRFYEAVTRYWLSQLVELTLLALIAAVITYRFLGDVSDPDLGDLFLALAILIVGLVVNRMFVRLSLNEVRRKTDEEIEEIVADHRTDLEARIKQLCRDEGFDLAE